MPSFLSFFSAWEYYGCYQTMFHKLLHFLNSLELSPSCLTDVNTWFWLLKSHQPFVTVSSMKAIPPWTVLPDCASNNIWFSAISVNLIEGIFKNILLLQHWRRDNKICLSEPRCAEVISACGIAKNGCYMARIWRAVVFKAVVCAKHKPFSAAVLWLWNLFPAVLWIMMNFRDMQNKI